MFDPIGVRRMGDPVVELPEPSRVILVLVGRDRDERLRGVAPQAVHERTERGDPVPGVDQQIAVPAADEPCVGKDQRVRVRLGDEVDARLDLRRLEPLLTNRQRHP